MHERLQADVERERADGRRRDGRGAAGSLGVLGRELGHAPTRRARRGRLDRRVADGDGVDPDGREHRVGAADEGLLHSDKPIKRRERDEVEEVGQRRARHRKKRERPVVDARRSGLGHRRLAHGLDDAVDRCHDDGDARRRYVLGAADEAVEGLVRPRDRCGRAHTPRQGEHAHHGLGHHLPRPVYQRRLLLDERRQVHPDGAQGPPLVHHGAHAPRELALLGRVADLLDRERWASDAVLQGARPSDRDRHRRVEGRVCRAQRGAIRDGDGRNLEPVGSLSV